MSLTGGGRPVERLIVVGSDGKPIAESSRYRINGAVLDDAFSFTLAAHDPHARHVMTMFTEVQLWRGTEMVGSYEVTGYQYAPDGKTIDFICTARTGDGSRPATLAEFLLARIAEDEYTANLGRGDDGSIPQSVARILRECEAKRRIVEDFMALPASYPSLVLEQALRPCCHLALPFADHPDYREEWKP